jgi:hypothetical protein
VAESVKAVKRGLLTEEDVKELERVYVMKSVPLWCGFEVKR